MFYNNHFKQLLKISLGLRNLAVGAVFFTLIKCQSLLKNNDYVILNVNNFNAQMIKFSRYTRIVRIEIITIYFYTETDCSNSGIQNYMN